VVYALKGSDVRDAMVNGKLILGDGRPVTLDRQKILAEAASWGAKIRGSLGK
jgi:hypothetical protein